MVSVVSVGERDMKAQEIVVKRRVEWGEAVDLGVVAQGGACVILMQDGAIGRIGTQALMGSWDAGQPCWIEVTNTENPTEIEGTDLTVSDGYVWIPKRPLSTVVSVSCKVLSQSPAQASPKKEAASEVLPKWVEWVDEGSSIGFLLMCLFVHLLYGVDGFHWTHKCCLTVGAALAITTILNGSSKPPPVTPVTPKASATSQLPKLKFSLKVHRCRIKMEGTEYLHPK
jgi:hypothetical protein